MLLNILALGIALFIPAAADDKQEIIIVGSSTVTPFGQAVIDRINVSDTERLVIDTTGTSGGISLFCRSETDSFAPILLASRAMTEEEMNACSDQLADGIREYKIGLSGIVLAEKAGNRPLKLTTSHIYRALAAFLPSSDDDCVFVRVWTQLIQHFAAKRYIMLMKFLRDFSNRVASRLMSFILQKNRSTILRMA
ncbi:substrate-binding domain-containing protein [Parvularcula sp. IMCC14364]|uniref:substrate-binding domain-containing protein n=1 Tax=Parvularcula sp. IMCC14364 TaxID=3067902 RepID=UPI003556D475